MAANNYTVLGIRGLDYALGGGILNNSVVLISFEPGTREWAFGAEVIRRSLLNEEYIIHLDFDHTPDYYLKAFLGVGIETEENQKKLADKFKKGYLKLIDCFTTEISSEKFKELDTQYTLIDNPYNLSKLLFTMKRVRESIPENARVRWVFSNITSLSINLEIQDVIKFCRSAFRFHKQMNDQAIYYVNKLAHPREFLSMIYQLVDTIIELKNKEVNNRTVTFLKVIKNSFKDHISSDLIYKVDRGKIHISILE
ncbi:MAG: RAD55 family ATPase [Candidatus Odinarchaeia archaeon]